MCTVTFIARAKGYALGMNRDERRTRVPGLPPRQIRRGGRIVVEPSEPGAGTWVALNDLGACLALINWYAVTTRAQAPTVSRGQVVQAVSSAAFPREVDQALAQLPLRHMHPFRLIGIFPQSREVVEWRWDLVGLQPHRYRWTSRQWASSGFDEPAAQRVRGRTFRQRQRQLSASSLSWLRRLHRSHAPRPGPFSTCMHRPDAVTVSYTEISVNSSQATLRHHNGAPCETPAGPAHRLRLVPTPLALSP